MDDACTRSAGIVKMAVTKVMITNEPKTIPMESPRLIPFFSSHWTVGFKVPTMKKAAIRTRRTGKSLNNNHETAKAEAKIIMVEGASSKRTRRFWFSIGSSGLDVVTSAHFVPEDQFHNRLFPTT